MRPISARARRWLESQLPLWSETGAITPDQLRDPSDPFRGRYVSLRFSAEEFPQPENLAVTESDCVYVRLRNDADGFARIESGSKEPLTGDDSSARTQHLTTMAQHVTLPFDRYWLDETIAPEADRAYAANSRQGVKNVYVTVRVLGGDAALEQLFIGGMPVREHLRCSATEINRSTNSYGPHLAARLQDREGLAAFAIEVEQDAFPRVSLRQSVTE